VSRRRRVGDVRKKTLYPFGMLGIATFQHQKAVKHTRTIPLLHRKLAGLKLDKAIVHLAKMG